MKFLALFISTFLALQGHAQDVPKLSVEERIKVQQAYSLSALQNLLSKKDNIIGIELVIADKGQAAGSQWGHALLHFVDNDKDPFNNIVMGFVAEVDDEKLSTFKGITGGYKVMTELKTLGEYWNQYVALEERALNRYVIPTSGNSRKELIKVTEEFFKNRERLGNYFFLGNNCATVMFDFLSQVSALKRFKLVVSDNHRENRGRRIDKIQEISSPNIPVSLPEYFAENALTYLPNLPMNNAVALHQQLVDLLKVDSYQDLLLGRWPKDNEKTIKIIEDNFKAKEIIRLLLEVINTPLEVRKKLARKYSFRTTNLTYEDVTGILQIPEMLYQTCEKASCLDDVNFDASKLWSNGEINQAQKNVAISLKKLKENQEFIRYKKIKMPLTQEYINHYQIAQKYLEAL